MSRAIAWFAENHVAANLLMLLLVVGGLASLSRINQKSFPDINVEVVSVGVAFLGAAPEEVEEGVCVRIEEEIQGIEGLDELSSTAAEGNCGVTARLISGYPVDRALSEIKNAVDGISTFPEDTEQPVVSHYSIRRNALQIALHGEVSERSLKIFGEQARDQISALPGVTQVTLLSVRPYEISIEVPEESLRRHGLTFDDVVRAVRRGSLDRPGGSIKTRSGEVLLRTKGQSYTGEDFERIVVMTRPDGTRLLLGEIARVVDGFDENERWARFDGEPSVMVQVFRVGDQKVLDLVETVKAWVAEAESQFPAGLGVTVWRDGAQVLRDRLEILVSNGRSGFILVFILLALFLRLRLAFWVAIGVPIAFLGSLALFPVGGISIDAISLFAFILVLGLLVDDAIVVGENVHRHQEKGEGALGSAIRGAQEVATPVIFGVLTTVAAFLPLIMAPGPMGQIFRAIGLVVVFCLIFSLVESQLVLPAHLGHMKIDEEDDEAPAQGGGLAGGWKRTQYWFAHSLQNLAARVYRPALETVLEWRYASLATGIVVLMLTVSLLALGHLKFNFFPSVEADYVTARLTMPFGTPPDVTRAAVQDIEGAAWELKKELDAEFRWDGQSVVRHVYAMAGDHPSTNSGPPRLLPGARGGDHLGEVSIELLGGDVRPISAKFVAERWRQLAPPILGAEELVFASSLFSVGDPIYVKLKSAVVPDLLEASEKLKARLAEYPGVIDIADSFREGKQEIKLALLPTAEPLGLTLDDLSGQVRQAFYGEEAQRIQRGRDDVRVMVRYPRAQRRSLDDLENLRIRTPDGGEVPFYAVAKADRGRGYANIKRSDRQRVVNVTADIDLTVTTANEVMADLRRNFLPVLDADYASLTIDFGGETREQRKTVAAVGQTYSFALVLIYVLLAVPLRSYLQPFIIMAVIPFGLVGAIGGHLLMGKGLENLGALFGVSGLGKEAVFNMSMMSMFGVVALSGVVVNASLVLVHYINRVREEGAPLVEAVTWAGVARFRPIVLTSITTFAGLTPLLLEGSISAQFLIPMAVSLAFGVIFASLISLFLVPSAYLILEDVKRLFRRAAPEPVRDPAPLAAVDEAVAREALAGGDDGRRHAS